MITGICAACEWFPPMSHVCAHMHACICLCLSVTSCFLYAAGQGSIATKGQEVADLQVNNEALLCMLERERQHSQRLAEALQQAEANALEVKPLHL